MHLVQHLSHHLRKQTLFSPSFEKSTCKEGGGGKKSCPQAPVVTINRKVNKKPNSIQEETSETQSSFSDSK